VDWRKIIGGAKRVDLVRFAWGNLTRFAPLGAKFRIVFCVCHGCNPGTQCSRSAISCIGAQTDKHHVQPAGFPRMAMTFFEGEKVRFFQRFSCESGGSVSLRHSEYCKTFPKSWMSFAISHRARQPTLCQPLTANASCGLSGKPKCGQSAVSDGSAWGKGRAVL
jgi:hypothetical protein